MGHFADQPQRSVARQPRIGVQGDDVAHPGRHLRRLSVDGHIAGVAGAAQQAVQLMQLAALSLPAHPPALHGIEEASAVEQQKAVTGRARAVALVQPGDRRAGDGKQMGVARLYFLIRIDAIGEQGEGQVATRACKVMHLQPFDLLAQVRLAGQQGWHHHQCSQRRWNAGLEFHTGQDCRVQPPGKRAIHQRGGNLAGRHDPDQRQQHKPAGRQAGGRQHRQRECQQASRDERERADIATKAQVLAAAADPQAGRGAKSDRTFERAPARADQVIAGIAAALRLGRIVRCAGPLRAAERQLDNPELRARGAARQLFDRAAIQVAGRKIHFRKGTARAQPRVDEADALEPLGPVDIGNQPHAGDDVAHRHVGGALALLRVQHHVIDGSALESEARLQPAQRRRGLWVLVAQAPGKLRGKHLGQWRAGAHGDIGLECCAGTSCGQQSSGQRIGIGAGNPPGGDLPGEPAQVLDQDNAQRNRHCPQFTDRQRLDALVGSNEAAQDIGVEVAVRVGDKGPSHPEDSRIAREWPLRELGKLAIVAGRQVVPDLADLLLHDVIVVEQPFRGRRYLGTAFQLGGVRPIGGQQGGCVLAEAAAQGPHASRRHRHRLRRGEALRVQFQPFNAEQLLSYRRCAIPWRHHGRRAERAQREGKTQVQDHGWDHTVVREGRRTVAPLVSRAP
ncbi:hypothetical protein FQZ97_512990 [compost metagenome]